MSHTIVVIPCFNEAGRLRAEPFISFAHDYPALELLAIDDGSNDGTLMRLYDLSRRTNGCIRVQRLATNQGKAEAVRQGLLSALRDQPDYVGYWDADLATPLEDIPRFARVLDEQPDCQLVIGTRVPLLGHYIHRSVWRRRMGRLFASLASLALAIPIYDTQCGAKLLRATPQLAALLVEPFLARWIFDVELLARLVKAHGQADPQRLIYEYSLDNWHEVSGSRLKLRDFADAPRQLGAIYWKYGRVGAAVRGRLKSAALADAAKRAA